MTKRHYAMLRHQLPLALLCIITTIAASLTCNPLAADPIVKPTVEQPTPLPHAHAHNDYWHDRPLLDALDQGFCSVESDIFLKDGQLLVGHSSDELDPARTLEALYLAPLRARVKTNGGRVFRDGPQFTLMADLKSGGLSTWTALRKLLEQYDDIVTSVDTKTGQLRERAITVIISGNRPIDAVRLFEGRRYVGLDGRLSDLATEMPSHLMPLISDRWTSHFEWRGDGPISDEELQKLNRIVKQSHDAGRRLRFWSTPENPQLWQQLQASGVDLINTDRLEQLREFMTR